MKYISMAALAALSLVACNQAPKNVYTISGTAADVDDLPVYLLSGRDTLSVDTIRNGQFQFTGVVDTPSMVIALTDRRHADVFFIEPGNISIDLNQASVQGTPLNDELQGLDDYIRDLALQAQNGADPDSLQEVLVSHQQEICANHIGDCLGLYLTQSLAQSMNLHELDSVMALCDLYQNDPELQSIAASKSAASHTAVGCQFVNIEGVNAQTGSSMSLADVIAQGKPVVVDFWASWCGPCRREIKEALSVFAPKYKSKVNFLGIAVWEQSVEDTQKAMSELPIFWPVLYANDGGQPTTTAYGIDGIPHIMLIGPDGTILARDLRGQAIADAIENYFSK